MMNEKNTLIVSGLCMGLCWFPQKFSWKKTPYLIESKSKIQILILEGMLYYELQCNTWFKEIQKKNKIFLFYRNAIFQLHSKQLSGNPETLQCLLVWGLQNYTRLIPPHWAPAKERAVACSHDPPAIQSPRDSQCCPSCPERWLPGLRRLFS